MHVHNVAVKHSQHNRQTYTRLLYDDGVFHATRGGWLKAVEHVVDRLGMDAPVYLIANNYTALARNAPSITSVFPNLHVGPPYDITSQALYDELRTYPDLVTLPPDETDTIVIGADAAVPRHNPPYWAWVRLSPGTDFAFAVGRAKQRCTATVETIALHNALLDRLQLTRNSFTIIQSDSRIAIREVREIIENGGSAKISRGADYPKYARARELIRSNMLEVRWVKGHNGDLVNTLADQAARCAASTREHGTDGSLLQMTVRARLQELLLNLSGGQLNKHVTDYRRAMCRLTTTS